MTLEESFLKRIESLGQEEVSEELLYKVTTDFIEEAAENLVLNFDRSSNEKVHSMRLLEDDFKSTHFNLWDEGLKQLDILLSICIDSGSKFSTENSNHKNEPEYVLHEVLVRLHGQCCKIFAEITYLLKGGFADAAMARWRALHEVNVTLSFINKHGPECARRFLDHEIIDSYNGMLSHLKFKDRINAAPPSQDECDEMEHLYTQVISKYENGFKSQYGWADIYVEKGTRGFQAIESSANYDHMRPYYKWASQNIHVNTKTLTKPLALPDFDPDLIHVGASHYGLTDPAHASALSILQATATLIYSETDLEKIVLIKALTIFADRIGDTFLKIVEKKFNS